MDRTRNAENKYTGEICGRCHSEILYLPNEKPSQCPDCEWRGFPWGDGTKSAKNPYDIPSDIKTSIPYSGPASGL